MSNIFQPDTFQNYPVVAALSLRDPSQPGEYSMLTTNTSAEVVEANRSDFSKLLNFEHLAVAHQDHSDQVYEITGAEYNRDEAPIADGIITNIPGWLLGVTIADCIAILLYDPEHSAIAAIHSGRRGTAQNIVGKTMAQMQHTFGTHPAQLVAYMSPCPNANEYPLDPETAKEQDERYLSAGASDQTLFYDNRTAVYDQLLAAGLKPEKIQVDNRSTIADTQFHSYRRDKKNSGRMVVAIGLKI